MKMHSDDKKFIQSLFKFTQPPNVISTYVYLYEYLYDPQYEYIYNNAGNNYYIPFSKYILETFIYPTMESFQKEGYYYANLCRICQFHVDLSMLDVEGEIDKIVKFVVDDQSEIENFKMIIKYFREHPFSAAKDGSGQEYVKQFTFRSYYNDDNQHKLYICHIKKMVLKEHDEIPNDKKEFFNFLNKKLLAAEIEKMNIKK